MRKLTKWLTKGSEMSKAQTRLTPGTYRVSVDMPPLRRDKRRSSDWRYNPIARGALLHYTEWTYAPNEEKPEATITEQRIYPMGEYSISSVAPNESSATRGLEECMVRVDETPTLWLRRNHGGQTAMRVLDALCASGKVTMAEIQALADRIETE